MKLSEKTWQGFYKEPCVYSEKVNALGEETRTLSCDSTAKSPLAGTKYIGKRFNGSCEQGDPDFQFVCISGCNSNNRAPQKMKQGHWEC